MLCGMRGMQYGMPPGKKPRQAHSECLECSAKIVPQTQITNIKARYLGFSLKFEGIWRYFIERRLNTAKGLRGGSPLEMGIPARWRE
jgi:hypothetical protein